MKKYVKSETYRDGRLAYILIPADYKDRMYETIIDKFSDLFAVYVILKGNYIRVEGSKCDVVDFLKYFGVPFNEADIVMLED